MSGKTEKPKYETSEHVVAFIDILGAKEFMKNPDSLEIVHDVFESAKSFLPYFNEEMKDIQKPDIGIKIFSDNIILFSPANNNKYNSYLVLLVYVSFLQISFWRKEILVRGGISDGQFFSDDIMVWGEALTKSYELESRIAFYPRVIIDSNISDEPIFDGLKKLNIVKKDVDGMFFTNPLHFENSNSLSEIIKLHIAVVKAKIESYNSDKKIQQKWEWHKQYLEDFLSDHRAAVNGDSDI